MPEHDLKDNAEPTDPTDVEPEEDVSTDVDTEPDTFPRAYVQQLRDESARYRLRASRADELHRRLVETTIRSAAADHLADPGDLLMFSDEADLIDDDATPTPTRSPPPLEPSRRNVPTSHTVARTATSAKAQQPKRTRRTSPASSGRAPPSSRHRGVKALFLSGQGRRSSDLLTPTCAPVPSFHRVPGKASTNWTFRSGKASTNLTVKSGKESTNRH